jgi:16S rRNA (adenine1518-N6/adenine1519-N6)-dimethyltransferase
MRKRKRLGQHFLASENVAKSIVSAAKLTKNDIVLEIGTGRGILVPLLCNKAKKVISIEYDKQLYEDAIRNFANISNLTLKHGNGFKTNEKFSVFVSNLPYSQSRKAIEWLIQKNYSKAVIMVQEDFAKKLLNNQKNHKAISVLVNYATDIVPILNVKKTNFSPQPKVNSTVIKLTRKKSVSKNLIQTVHKLFSFRRKTLQNVLKQFGQKIQSGKRIDDLTGDEIIKIAKRINKK